MRADKKGTRRTARQILAEIGTVEGGRDLGSVTEATRESGKWIVYAHEAHITGQAVVREFDDPDSAMRHFGRIIIQCGLTQHGDPDRPETLGVEEEGILVDIYESYFCRHCETFGHMSEDLCGNCEPLELRAIQG